MHRNYVAPGADRPPAAARALAEYIVRLLPPIVSIDKSSGQNHRAKKRPGLIDFSLSSLPPATAESHFDARVARLKAEDSDGGLGVTYTPPEAGGRMRKDGVEVKWKLSRPKFSRAVHTPSEDLFPNGRIDAPFFCYDVTSRDVRVPFEDREKAGHPSGATGVSAVEILVPKAQLDAYIKLYSNILGSMPRAVNEHERGEGATFEIGLPVREAGLSRIRIRAEENEGDIAWLKERGVGISRVVLSVGGREKYGKAQLGAEGVASTIWVE